ncbi:hypothetical protein [Mycobacterium avium]|uniref:hypothetical protein n=1 Tax=Mycobacterium avium TaxID=1764 RepID=UPI0005349972|nr:hypothetical protein [Mycobacterium avium]
MAEIDIMTQTAPYPRELARAGMCCGCGYYFAVHGAHRADCTTELGRRERDRSGRARCDCCGDKTPVKSLRWDRYRWQCAACAGGLIGAGNGA